jgi:membrane protein involved in colicin uptake
MTVETVTYDTSSAIALTGQAQAALDSALDLVIDSPTMYELAGDELRNLKSLQKLVEEKRTAITGPLNQALKATNDLFRAPKEYLEKAEAACKRSMITYTTEVERRAAEARRIAEEEARRERDRLAAEQREQERIAREAAEAAARAQREAQEAAARGDAEAAARAQEEARQQTEAANSAQADAQATAMTAEVVSIAPSVAPPAKVSGISGRVNYTAQVDDFMALVRAVAEGKAPVECICANEKFLGAQARAFKKAGALYPGVTAVAERGISARAA